MRLFGYDLSLRRSGEKQQAPVVAVGLPASAHFAGVLGYGFAIKDQTPYDDIDKIVRSMPFVDTGLRKYCRLCGGFKVRSKDQRTQDTLNRWLGHPTENGSPSPEEVVLVDWVQRGFESWLMRHLRSMFVYGKAMGEVVLDGTGRDLYQLVNLTSKSVALRYEDGKLVYGQKDALGWYRWFERQDLFAYNVNGPEGDDPHGTSLLRSAPWLSNIALTMENALRQLWQRHGAPAQLLDLQLPDLKPGENINDEVGTKIEASLRSAFKAAALDRFQADGVRDFTTVHHGTLTNKSIGADLHELAFTEPFRAMTEQIIAGIELPPFMLGIQWSTTERLSQQQADAILSCVNSVRAEVEPDCLRICQIKANLNGLRGDIEADWAEVSLQDRVERARAKMIESQADKTRHDLAVDRWRQGFITQEQAAEESLGEDFEGGVATVLESPVVANPAPAFGVGALSAGGNGNGKTRAERFATYP